MRYYCGYRYGRNAGKEVGMLTKENTLLLIVDVQEKLVPHIYGRENLIKNLTTVIRGAQVLSIPLIYTEQVPQKIGKTISPIAQLLAGVQPIIKNTFSCCQTPSFIQQLKVFNRRHILLAGVETHVCIYQTAMDLLGLGYQVHLIADAVSSRTLENKSIAIERMKQEKVCLTSVEMALCEILRTADDAKFKEIIELIK